MHERCPTHSVHVGSLAKFTKRRHMLHVRGVMKRSYNSIQKQRRRPLATGEGCEIGPSSILGTWNRKPISVVAILLSTKTRCSYLTGENVQCPFRQINNSVKRSGAVIRVSDPQCRESGFESCAVISNLGRVGSLYVVLVYSPVWTSSWP